LDKADLKHQLPRIKVTVSVFWSKLCSNL